MASYEWILDPAAPRPGDDPYLAWAEATCESLTPDGAAAPPRKPAWILNPPRPDGALWSSTLAASHLEGFTASHAKAAAAARPCPAALRPESLPKPGARPCAPAAAQSAKPAKGRRVVVIGLMDDAINLAHLRFQGPGGTSRIDYAWVMDGTAGDAPTTPFGREWTGAEIAALLQKPGAREASVLKTLELEDPNAPETMAAAKRVHHGTHMLDLAAGFAPDDPDGAEIRIVAVQLPRGVILETSGATLSPFVIAGLRFIETRAAMIAASCGGGTPLVVNFSFGLGAGPHDGGHPIEQAMADMTGPRDPADPLGPVQTVMPAGNRFRADGHAAVSAEADERATITLDWMIAGGDASPNFLEIWAPADAADVRVKIAAPDGLEGEADGAALSTGALSLRRIDGATGGDETRDVVAWAIMDAAACGERRRIFVAIDPTAGRRPGFANAPPGEWRLQVDATLSKGGRIEAWIQRDEEPFGYRRLGAASRLVDRDWTRAAQRTRDLSDHGAPEPPDNRVEPYGSLNALATGPDMIVAGAYRWRDQSISSYSGAAGPRMRTPDLAAPADRSRVMGGVPAAGGRSGSVVALNGTSVAAPQVARALALALVDGDVDIPGFIASRCETPSAANPGPSPLADERRGRGALFRPEPGLSAAFGRSVSETRLVR